MRPIKGIEGYGVTKDGRIWSYKTNRFLAPKKQYRGYHLVNLSCGSRTKVKTKTIHRIVAEAFIPNPHNLPQINHKNGIKTYNSVSNLEWCTNQENRDHAEKMGLVPHNKKI